VGEDLSERLVDSLSATYGVHAGHRAAHAKGVLCAATFTPTRAAPFTARPARTIFRARLSTKADAGDAQTPPRQPFRYRLEAAGLRAASTLVPLLSRDVAMGVGRVLGRLAFLLLREDRRVAFANLDIAFGDTKSLREKRRIARRSFQNLTCNLVGLFWAPRITAENFRQFVEVDETDFQWGRAMREQGRGVIFITPHYGDWEIMSLAGGFLRTPYTTVTEPTKNPAIQETISRLRRLSGHTTVDPRFVDLNPPTEPDTQHSRARRKLVCAFCAVHPKSLWGHAVRLYPAY